MSLLLVHARECPYEEKSEFEVEVDERLAAVLAMARVVDIFGFGFCCFFGFLMSDVDIWVVALFDLV